MNLVPSKGLGSRVGGFFIWQLISALLPFVVLPIVARVGGEGGWNSVVVGQATGSFAAIATVLGWSITGPARVAGASEGARRRLYNLSVKTRLCVFTLAAPAMAIVAGAVIGDWVLAPLISLAVATSGLLPGWYFIGLGRPLLFARYELAPRIAASVLAALIIVFTGQLVVYPVALFLAAAVSLVTFRPGAFENPVGWHNVRRELLDQRTIATANLFSGTYSALPVPIVALAGTANAVAAFAAADKLYRVGVFAVGTLTISLQGWVAEVPTAQGHRRKQAATTAHALLGVLGLVGFVLLGPSATALLFGTELIADRATCALFGLAFLALSVNSSLGNHWLAPARAEAAILLSTAIGAIVGVVAIATLALPYGATGAAAGVALGEVVVAMIQAIAVVRLQRRHP